MPRSRYLDLLGVLCGFVGPACFITGWIVAGAKTPGYSGVREAISQLARIGAPHRLLMTAAFVGFSLTMLVFARALSKHMDDSKMLLASVTLAAIAVLGVASFPLSRESGGLEDTIHGVWAISGYVGTAFAPVIGGWILFSRGARMTALVSVVVGLASGAALSATSFTSDPGLLQRTGLTLVDLWFMTVSVGLASGRLGWGRPRQVMKSATISSSPGESKMS